MKINIVKDGFQILVSVVFREPILVLLENVKSSNKTVWIII